MPLNPEAKEWLPQGALSKQFSSLNKAHGPDSPISCSRYQGPTKVPRHFLKKDIVPDIPATLSTREDPVFENVENEAHSQEEEWQFEEVFDRQLADSDVSSPRSPHRSSLVGPSPIPSPIVSPSSHTCANLVEQTERLSLKSQPNHKEAETENDNIGSSCPDKYDISLSVSHVVTHVETATSAAASISGIKKKLGPDDFELLRVVGQGAFGKVFQVRKKDTNEVFAMKVMRKDRILDKNHGEYVRAERNALTAVVHPYIVTLRYSFQTKKKLYLVLDFINGGHLFFQLYRAGTFDENLAKLYTAELVSALTHLHSLGFVHRDLKPENVLLDSEGHVKVTDFGLAKGNMSDAEHHRTNSFIGTMEYMAPEVIQGKGHGKAVDWWSTGILLYEMLCGMPPFRSKSKAALQKSIISGKFKLPPYLSTEASNLLKGLLTKDATKRLGYGPDGSENVKRHVFFRGIDWKKLEMRDILSPFKPSLQSHDSVENFDKIWTDLPAHDSPCNSPQQGTSLDNTEFEGFTYQAPSCLLANLNSK